MVSGSGEQTRQLIVNADDFGLTVGVNRGVVRAHEEGIVTSASLMVRHDAARAAAREARSHPRLDLGLHLDLSEWAYRGGGWEVVYEVVDPDNEAAVAAELQRQLQAFRDLVGRDPSHLDSHQHVHRSPGIASVVNDAAERLGVPVRESSPTIRYCGEFYGESGRGEGFAEGITVESMVAIIERLTHGTTELACHPGDGDCAELPVHYREARVTELRTLCDPAVRDAIDRNGVVLTTFAAITDRKGRADQASR